MGGAALRSGAFSDAQVVDLVNARFVPVWINIRRDPVPPLPDQDKVLLRATLDSHRHITGSFSEGFFLRSLVLSSDARQVLNPQAKTPEESVKTWRQCGYFAYGQVKAEDYLPMLREALQRAEPASTSR